MGGIAWLLKVPQKAWDKFLLWAIFKHGHKPRKAILFVVRRAEWHFGAVGPEPATQLHIDLTITNITDRFDIAIVEGWFRPTWSWRRPLVRRSRARIHNFGEHIPARTVTETAFSGFSVPRIEHERRAIRGFLEP